MGGSKSDKSGAEAGLQQVGQNVQQAAAQTPQEAQQYSGSFDIGSLLKQLYEGQMGIGSLPQGYQNPMQQFLGQNGDLGQAIYNQILPQIQNPDQYFESTLQPQLQQAMGQLDAEYQRRGLLNSGLNIEAGSRAGIELAIQDAMARMNFRQQALQNAFGLQQNATGQANMNLAALSNLYGTQQQLGQNSLGRQAQGAQAAAPYQSYGYQAALGDYYSGQAAKQALPGQLIGAAGTIGGAFLGGPAGAAIGGALANKIGGSITRPQPSLAQMNQPSWGWGGGS